MSFGAAFLARPEALAEPVLEEPWGDRRVTLDCAGLYFAFEGINAGQAEALRQHLGAFTTSGVASPADELAVTRVVRTPRETFLHPPTRGWELWMDFDYQPAQVRAASLRMLSWLRWRPAPESELGSDLEGTVATCVAEGPEFLGVLENHLRVLVAYRLLAVGGVLLHSSGVVDGQDQNSAGRAYLFLGPSGAGKTTVARLSREQGLAVLSDDMNGVIPQPETAGVYRVPFAGEPALSCPMGESEPLPLAALVRLRQGETSRLRSLTRSQALAHLAACAPFVNRDPHRQEALLHNLESLLRTTPALELEFPRSGGFWPMLRQWHRETPCLTT